MVPAYCAPTMKFTVQKLQRSISTIWKDDTVKATPNTRPVIYTRNLTRKVIDPTETWSNCRAVRIKPGNRCCNYLAVIGHVVKGITQEIVPEEDGKIIYASI